MFKHKSLVVIVVILLVVLLTTTLFACNKNNGGENRTPSNVVIVTPPELPKDEEPPAPKYDESHPRQNMLDYYGLSESVSLTESSESLSEQAIRLSIINNFFDTLENTEINI